jgi:spore coat-associated protein N
VGRRMKLRRRRLGAVLGGGRMARGRTALGGRAAAGGLATTLDRHAWRTAGGPATPASVVGGATLAAAPPADPDPASGNRRRTLATLALGLIAVATAVGSGADFSARTANPSNTFSAGSLSMENSKDGTAILSATDMKPGGAPQTGVVDIKNTGSIDGRFTLSRDQLSSGDGGANNPTPFENKVAIGIVDCGRFTTSNGPYGPEEVTPTCGDSDDSTLYLGSLANENSALALGTYQPGEQHRYRFEASLDSSAGDEYQGDGASARYVFDAVQKP